MAEDGTPSLSTIDRIRRGDPKLNVLNASLNDSDVADILPVLKGSNAITVIQIRMGGLTNVGARLIASLIADKMITTLDLRHNKITDDGVLSLCNSALNLVSLNLSYNSFSVGGATALGRLCNSTGNQLRELYMDHNDLGDDGVIGFCKELTVPSQLRTIGISHVKCTAQSVPSLLSGNAIGNSAAQFADLVFDHSCLVILDLAFCGVDNQAILKRIDAFLFRNQRLFEETRLYLLAKRRSFRQERQWRAWHEIVQQERLSEEQANDEVKTVLLRVQMGAAFYNMTTKISSVNVLLRQLAAYFNLDKPPQLLISNEGHWVPAVSSSQFSTDKVVTVKIITDQDG